MNYYKIFFIMLFLILSISTVSAVDNNTDIASLNNDSSITDIEEGSGCASVVIHVNDGDSVISFRRDSSDPATLYIVEENFDGINAIKQYKTDYEYFAHVIVTDNGWVYGDGGVNDGSTNKMIENKAKSMIASGVISEAILKELYQNVYRSQGVGHFVIKAPDGTFGVIFPTTYFMGKLNPGDYLVVPNKQSFYKTGNLGLLTSDEAINKAIYLIANDGYGINRRNVMTYHYHYIADQSCYGVNVFASNDDGSYVGLRTGGLADNFYYKGVYYSKNSIPMILDKMVVGTHLFENTREELTLAEPVTSAVVNEPITIKYKYDKGASSSTFVQFAIPVNMDYVNAVVSAGSISYDATNRILIWNFNNVGSNYLDLVLKPTIKGTFTISASCGSKKLDTIIKSYNYGVKMDCGDVNKYYGSSERLVVYLTDLESNPLYNENVNVHINGVNYVIKTDNKGVASMGINLIPGVYEVLITYNGIHGFISLNRTATILSTVSGDDITMYFKNGTRYYAKFLNKEGSPLANSEVNFNINGVIYTKTTDNQGIASLAINLNPYNYIITTQNLVTGEFKSNNIKILSTIISKDIVKYYRNDTQYYATFLDGQGNPLKETMVTFNINGVFYEKITDENGVAKLTINLNPGTYIITAINPINGELYSNIVEVLPVIITSDLEKKYREVKPFEVKIINGSGSPLANETVIFNINGVFYNKTTDFNGIAMLNINLNVGTYIITSYWNATSVSNKVIIKS